MTRFLGAIAALVVLLLAGTGGWVFARIEAEPDAPIAQVSELSDARFAEPAGRVLAAMEAMRRERGWPSMSFAIGVEGQLVWAGTTGYADLEEARPATPADRYRVGSVAKALTAVAFGQLAEEGKLSLDDPVARYVDPALFPADPVVTLRQLASHTAGVRHYGEGLGGMLENYHQVQYDSAAASLALFADDPLLFDPGSDYRYSSYGYNALSAALARADGRSFLALMNARVFEPAAMAATEAEHPPQDPPTEAIVTPYLLYDGTALRAPGLNNSYKWAGGGFLSTPSDLVRFGLELLSGGYLTPEMRAELWQVTALKDGTASPGAYGLGFQIGTHQDREFVAHGGGSVGGNTYFVIFPELGLVGASVANVAVLSGPWNTRDATRDWTLRFASAGLQSAMAERPLRSRKAHPPERI